MTQLETISRCDNSGREATLGIAQSLFETMRKVYLSVPEATRDSLESQATYLH
jgi:hypothetical protein